MSVFFFFFWFFSFNPYQTNEYVRVIMSLWNPGIPNPIPIYANSWVWNQRPITSTFVRQKDEYWRLLLTFRESDLILKTHPNRIKPPYFVVFRKIPFLPQLGHRHVVHHVALRWRRGSLVDDRDAIFSLSPNVSPTTTLPLTPTVVTDLTHYKLTFLNQTLHSRQSSLLGQPCISLFTHFSTVLQVHLFSLSIYICVRLCVCVYIYIYMYLYRLMVFSGKTLEFWLFLLNPYLGTRLLMFSITDHSFSCESIQINPTFFFFLLSSSSSSYWFCFRDSTGTYEWNLSFLAF